MSEFTGSCLCGKVRYAIEGEAVAFYHCHCGRCRKTYGTGHASNIRIDTQHITWLSGADLVKRYKIPEAIRFRSDFCGECGSPMPRYFEETQFVVLPAGTLDSEPPIMPQARIFHADKTAWSCTDSLPVYAEYPQ